MAIYHLYSPQENKWVKRIYTLQSLIYNNKKRIKEQEKEIQYIIKCYLKNHFPRRANNGRYRNKK